MGERLDLVVGQRIRLDGKSRWWTVQAVSENFAAAVQSVPFSAAGTLQYTVLDWRAGRRGPCNLIGQGYGDGSYSMAECEEMLGRFESGDLEVSRRNNVTLDVTEVDQ